MIKQTTPAIPRIRDEKNLTNHGILMLDSSTLQSIFTSSGPKAVNNEFQVHYWALVMRHTAVDGSLLDVCIPTTFFNYKQEVSGAAINFEMKDVKEMSDRAEAIHNHVLKSFNLDEISTDLKNVFGVDFEATATTYNSIHRHPGSSTRQSFSGTDLDTNPEEHGVVYPFKSPKDNAPNFAGIMAIDSGTCRLAHNEYRIANGELGKDIKYEEGRCVAIVVENDLALSEVNKIFFQPREYYIKEKNFTLTEELAVVMSNLYKEWGIKPNTILVRSEHLTQRTYTYQPPYKKFSPSTQLPTQEGNHTQNMIKDMRISLQKKTYKELRKEYIAGFIHLYGEGSFDQTEQLYLESMTKQKLIDELLDIKIDILSEQEDECNAFLECSDELLLSSCNEDEKIDQLRDELFRSYGVHKMHTTNKSLAELEQLLKFVQGELDALIM